MLSDMAVLNDFELSNENDVDIAEQPVRDVRGWVSEILSFKI